MSSSAQHVQALVRRQILNGSRAPGERIGEVALAAEFTVSRTPARTALAALEAEGLIEKRAGRGYTIRSISTASPVWTAQTPRAHRLSSRSAAGSATRESMKDRACCSRPPPAPAM